MHFSAILLFLLVLEVCSRRHHHYHYHVNNTNHEDVRSQKITTIDVDDGFQQGFNPYNKHGPG